MPFVEVHGDQAIRTVETLAREIWSEHYGAIISAEQVAYMVGNFQSARAIAEQIREGYRYFLISPEGVGEGYFSILSRPDARELFLSKLYLRSALRGKGLGRQALSFVEGIAVSEGLSRVTLTVNKGNLDSIGFYEKCGFRKARAIVKDIGGGFVMDDWIMEKQF